MTLRFKESIADFIIKAEGRQRSLPAPFHIRSPKSGGHCQAVNRVICPDGKL